MNNLYKKVGFLAKIDKKYKRSKKQRSKPKYKDVEFKKENLNFKTKVARRISHNLRTEESIKVEVLLDGKPVKSSFKIINENRISVELETEAKNVVVLVKGKKQIFENPIVFGLEQVARLAMGFKQVSASFAQTNGSVLGGYNQSHALESMLTSPGAPFILGWQDSQFGYDMSESENIIRNENLITPFTQSKNTNVSGKATYQPFRDLRIDFAGQRNITQQFSEYYYPRYDESTGNYSTDRENYKETGTYSISVWMMSTSFKDQYTRSAVEGPEQSAPSSRAFEKYKENLLTVAWRDADARLAFAQQEGINYQPGAIRDSMPNGYSTTNPAVAIPAFLAAYTGGDANTVALGAFSWSFFRPSWRVKYDGLAKLSFLKKYFKNITISNAYNGAFTVGGYGSNTEYDYEAANSGYSFVTNTVDTTMFLAKYDMTSFAATESYVPLIGIDMTWKNNVITKFEYKKTRTLAMSLTNNQMVEDYNWEYTIGTGYRFDKLKIIVNKKPIVSDLNIRGDLSVRENLQIKRNLAQNFDDISDGQKVLAIKLSAEYQMSEKLMVRSYFDHIMTNPKVGSFRRSDTEFGVQLRFSLAQ